MVVGAVLVFRGYAWGDPVFNRSLSKCGGDVIAALKDCGTTQLDDDGNIVSLALEKTVRRGTTGKRLPDLRHNNAVLAYVKDIASIRSLRIGALTEIDDRGMTDIGRMTQLELLNLNGIPVTDEGLQQLHALKNLKRISLYATKVTESGVVSLIEAIPGCEVFWGNTLDADNPVRKTWSELPGQQPLPGN